MEKINKLTFVSIYQCVVILSSFSFHLKDMSVPLQTPSKNEQWNWAQMYKIPPEILDDLCRSVLSVFEFLGVQEAMSHLWIMEFDPEILNMMAFFCSRFIVNVPEEERKDLVRLFFQIELAHWFYIDFYCSEENSTRKQCNFKEFSANIFKVIKLFVRINFPIW